MAQLSFTGVSADGERLLLAGEDGTEFTLEVTSRLRAALRTEKSGTARLETQMSNSLRPREIQTRIRAGESPQAVAAAAGTTVDAILPFVAPVLAEREHVATRAQKSSVRRIAGEGPGSPRALGDAVAGHLRTHDVRPESVTWDAFRRDDGRWVLTATYDTSQRSGVARFAYDPPGSFVLAENDEARWLIGDLATQPAAPAARNDLEEARQRRMAASSYALGNDELPLGDDAIGLVTGEAADALTEPLPPRREDPTPPEDLARIEHVEQGEDAEDDASVGDVAVGEADRGRRRAVQKKRGRASVPSWDEIMFGGGDQ